jgi:hypothetical protein
MSRQNGDSGEQHEEDQSTSTQLPQSAWRSAWQNNKGVFLIILAQMAGSSMDAMVRFLQQGGHGMHPFQVIFARMSTTYILSIIYMWWTKVPDFPLGHSSVRGLLAVRALFGFFGLFCLYCKAPQTRIYHYLAY